VSLSLSRSRSERRAEPPFAVVQKTAGAAPEDAAPASAWRKAVEVPSGPNDFGDQAFDLLEWSDKTQGGILAWISRIQRCINNVDAAVISDR
jgi:hypothetical protein